MLLDAGWASVGARFDKPWDSGYWLQLHADGTWKIAANGKFPAEGRIKSKVPGRWQRLSVNCSGNTIAFFIDGAKLASLEDTTFKSGLAGLGTGWNSALFDNFEVHPTPSKQ